MIQFRADYRWPAGIIYGQDDAVYMYHTRHSPSQVNNVPVLPTAWPHRIPLSGKRSGWPRAARSVVSRKVIDSDRAFGSTLYINGSFNEYELLAQPTRGHRLLGSVPYYTPDLTDHVIFRRHSVEKGREIRHVPAGASVARLGSNGGYSAHERNYLETYRDLQSLTLAVPRTRYPELWLPGDSRDALPNVFRRCHIQERDVLVGLITHSFHLVALGTDAPWGVLPGLDPASIVSDFDFSPCGTWLVACVIEDHRTLAYFFSVTQDGDRWTFTPEKTYHLPALFTAWSPDGLSIALLGTEDEPRVKPFHREGRYALCDTLTLIDSQ